MTTLDPTLLVTVLAWVPERGSIMELGGDGTLLRAICAARPEARRVGVDDAPPGAADVILCVDPVDPLRVLDEARRLLQRRGHFLLTAPLSRGPADLVALANRAGAAVLHMEAGTWGALYLMTWPEAA